MSREHCCQKIVFFLYILDVYDYGGFVIWYLQNEKGDYPIPPPFEADGVRIVLISFRSIVENPWK